MHGRVPRDMKRGTRRRYRRVGSRSGALACGASRATGFALRRRDTVARRASHGNLPCKRSAAQICADGVGPRVILDSRGAQRAFRKAPLGRVVSRSRQPASAATEPLRPRHLTGCRATGSVIGRSRAERATLPAYLSRAPRSRMANPHPRTERSPALGGFSVFGPDQGPGAFAAPDSRSLCSGQL